MKPLIGITMGCDHRGQMKPGVNYSFIRQEYGRQVKENGGEPIFLDYTIDPETVARLCDGIVISGGDDIDPLFYGALANQYAGDVEPAERTAWEIRLIDACRAKNVPILGICYGMQLINVHLGGTLWQDLEAQCHTFEHGGNGKVAFHEVTTTKDIVGMASGTIMTINSRHHQAIRDLAPGLTVTAVARDGIVEAIEGDGLLGFQWHPESDDSARAIYGSFVSICRAVSRDVNPVL